MILEESPANKLVRTARLLDGRRPCMLMPDLLCNSPNEVFLETAIRDETCPREGRGQFEPAFLGAGCGHVLLFTLRTSFVVVVKMGRLSFTPPTRRWLACKVPRGNSKRARRGRFLRERTATTSQTLLLIERPQVGRLPTATGPVRRS